MNLYEIYGDENAPAYQQLAFSNNLRQQDFLSSMVEVAIASGQRWVSESLIKALNFHAIVGLHSQAGSYRSYDVHVGPYQAPLAYRVPGLMENFVNDINWNWQSIAPLQLASWALWRLNHIHPFVNGNGRTARAVCYYILCVKSGGLIPGRNTLPEIINGPLRADYEAAMKAADNGDRTAVDNLVLTALRRQLASSGT